MKKTILPFLALVLAVSLSAFTIKKAPSTVLTQKYFDYLAYPSDALSDVNNPANYMLTGSDGSTPPNCGVIGHQCGVLADDDGSGQPVISSISQNFKKP